MIVRLDGLLQQISPSKWKLKEYKLQNNIKYRTKSVLWRHKHLTFLVTHFVEVLILHSNSTDGVTGVDKFIQQKLLLLHTNLKSCIDGEDEFRWGAAQAALCHC